ARCYVRNCVMTVVVGVRFTRDARRAVRDNCVCLGHSRAALVRHRTSYRAVQNLSLQPRHEQDGLNAQDSSGNKAKNERPTRLTHHPSFKHLQCIATRFPSTEQLPKTENRATRTELAVEG